MLVQSTEPIPMYVPQLNSRGKLHLHRLVGTVPYGVPWYHSELFFCMKMYVGTYPYFSIEREALLTMYLHGLSILVHTILLQTELSKMQR